MEEQQLQKIEDYLLGKLKDKELDEFRQKQADDSDFAKAVQQEEALFNGDYNGAAHHKYECRIPRGI